MSTTQRVWTEKAIEDAINEVRYSWLLDRMPSRKEVEDYYGGAAESCAIMKSGGYYHWAKKLGLEIKRSQSSLGYEVENEVKELIECLGYRCESTSTRHPYDLLVNGCVKIDVKAARVSKANGSDCYSFRLAKPQQTCDVYVAVCLNDDKEPQKIYVIPAHVMTGKTQLAIGAEHSKYDQYIDRWDIIDQLLQAFERI